MLVLVQALIWRWCSTCELWVTFRGHLAYFNPVVLLLLLLHLINHSLLIFQLLQSLLLLLELFLSVLLVDLLLEFNLHFSLLLLSSHLDDIFLVTTCKDTILLQLPVKPAFFHTTTRHDLREVLLCL